MPNDAPDNPIDRALLIAHLTTVAVSQATFCTLMEELLRRGILTREAGELIFETTAEKVRMLSDQSDSVINRPLIEFAALLSELAKATWRPRA